MNPNQNIQEERHTPEECKVGEKVSTLYPYGIIEI